MRSVPSIAALCVSILAAVPATTTAGDPSFARVGPHPVGVRTILLVDESREDALTGEPRTLVTEVWYPAADEARGRPPTRFVDFFGRSPESAAAFVEHFGGEIDAVNRRFRSIAVRDVPPRDGRFPLLVFSHGNGGVRHQNSFQMDHLASHGYVIASPDHTGNAGVTVLPDRVVPYDRRGRSRSRADRPRDVTFVIDRLLEEAARPGSWLHRRLDPEAIGVLGHSFGGFTACQVAATDPRVKAILPMTLALGPPVSMPVLLMLGDMDRTLGKLGNAASRSYYLSCSGPSHILTLERGGHFTFSDMDSIAPDFGDGVGSETRDGTEVRYIPSDRAKDIINAYSLAFFEAYLRENTRAADFLAQNAYPEEARVDARGLPSAGAGGDAPASSSGSTGAR